MYQRFTSLTETETASTIPWWFVMIAGISTFIVGLLLLISRGGLGLALLGILNIIFGVILLFNPLLGVRALLLILGIFALIGGIVVSVRAFMSRPQGIPVQPPGRQSV